MTNFHWGDLIKTNILTEFHDYRTDQVASRAYKVFLWFDLVTYFLMWHDPFSNMSEISSRQTFWPSFMIIRLKMWPLKHTQGFSKIWPSNLVLTWHDPFSNLSHISSRQTFWPSFMIIGIKMWPLGRTQGLSKIWPSDLVFNPTWPIF